jgi:hypothetical protein
MDGITSRFDFGEPLDPLDVIFRANSMTNTKG